MNIQKIIYKVCNTRDHENKIKNNFLGVLFLKTSDQKAKIRLGLP